MAFSSFSAFASKTYQRREKAEVHSEGLIIILRPGEPESFCNIHQLSQTHPETIPKWKEGLNRIREPGPFRSNCRLGPADPAAEWGLT